MYGHFIFTATPHDVTDSLITGSMYKLDNGGY